MTNGRNLYLGSKTFETYSYWRRTSNWAAETDSDGFVALTRSSGAWGGFAPYIYPRKGDVLTLSFEAKTNGAAALVDVRRNVALGNVTTGLVVLAASPNVASWSPSAVTYAAKGQAVEEWTRYWCTIEVTEDGAILQWRIECSTDGSVSLRKMKLEYGSEATPWRAAPEDLEGASDMILATSSCTLAVAVDVEKVDAFYAHTAATASAPGKPSAATPSSPWQATEPAYDPSKQLWTCQRTTLTDGSFYWGEVSKSSSYSGANAAYNRADAAYSATQPIASRKYTGLIGANTTTSDSANNSFYFAKVHPTAYTAQWRVKMEIRVTAPAGYTQRIIVEVCGDNSNFRSYNAFVSRDASLAIYYVNLYRATSAGITAKKGHALGIGLRASTNQANATYARTVEVDILEAGGCTVAMLDAAVKYASMDGTGSTNYAGLTEMGVTANGQNATNNANIYNRLLYSQAVKARAQDSSHTGYTGTHIICGTADGYVNIAAGAKFDLSYPLLWYATAATTTIAAGATANNHYLRYESVPYTVNGTVQSGAAYKMLYLKGTVAGGTFTVAAAPFMTTVVPTSADGYVYIPLGSMTSATAGSFVSSDSLWAYKDGAFQELSRGEASLASKTATSYIMDYGSGSAKGVWFTPEDRKANSDGTPNADTRGWRIGDALELFRGVASVFKVWAEDAVARVRVGEEGKSRFEVGADSLQAYDQDNAKYFEVSSEGLRWGGFGEGGEQFSAASRGDMANLAGNLSDLADSTDARLSEWEAAIEEAGAASQLIYMGDEGIVIGQEEGDVAHVLTNSRDSFRYKGAEVAAIGVDGNGDGSLLISNASIGDTLYFGKFVWLNRENGNLSLKWNG